MASIYKRKYIIQSADGAVVKECKTYTIQYRDADGKTRRVKGYRDKGATMQLAAKLERALAMGEQGLVDPYKEHRGRAITAHVADYIAELRTLGRDDKYRYNVEKRLAKLIDGCGWKVLADVTADSFSVWRATPIEQRMAESEDGRIGPRTLNQYLEALRAFCKWCVKRNRMGSNPLAAVEMMDESMDVRRARRALTAEQVTLLLAAVGDEHRFVYRFMLATGLRRQEVADLQWGDCRLDAPMPFLKLRAKATKSRRADTLPLRVDLADELRRIRGDAGETDKVFAVVPAIDLHKDYLIAAGIEFEDESGRRADIHALRHTYGTLLSNAGVSPREAMELMRHTDLKLTMKVYTDPRIFNLAGAVEKLPLPPHEQQKQLASGTDGTPLASPLAPSSFPRVQTGARSSKAKADDLSDLSVDLVRMQAGAKGDKMRHVGLEPTEETHNRTENTSDSTATGANTGPTFQADDTEVGRIVLADNALGQIVSRWPSLSPDQRRSIINIINQ